MLLTKISFKLDLGYKLKVSLIAWLTFVSWNILEYCEPRIYGIIKYDFLNSDHLNKTLIVCIAISSPETLKFAAF